MKAQVKAMLTVTIISLALAGIAFGLFSTQWQIQAQVTIQGVKLGVYKWVSDPSTKGAVKSTHNFDSLSPGETKESEFLIIESESVGKNMTIDFTSSIDSAIGSVVWMIEAYDTQLTQWVSYDWKANLNKELQTTSGVKFYLPGSNLNPITPGQKLGFRVQAINGWAGHIWMKFVAKADAPMGQVEFGITVTGTEK